MRVILASRHANRNARALANLGARTRNRDLIAQGRAAMEEALRIYQNDDGAADYCGNKLDQIDEMLKAVS